MVAISESRCPIRVLVQFDEEEAAVLLTYLHCFGMNDIPECLNEHQDIHSLVSALEKLRLEMLEAGCTLSKVRDR